MQVLIRFAHGLGDCVQFTVILKHLRKHRPGWTIDVRMGRGKHNVAHGLCHAITHDQEPEPHGPYDRVIDLGWWENYNCYDDRPNSKVTNCLAEIFGLGWDAELGQYQIQIRPAAMNKAREWLSGNGIEQVGDKFKAVCLHYEGNTSPSRKNLDHWQAREIVETVQKCGRVPIILDWDRRSPLIDHKTVLNPGTSEHGDIWGGFGSGDAEVLAALIQSCEAFIGIDSGPGKVASATHTPSMICWHGHHPMQFHDPAAHTVHLVPATHREMNPIRRSQQMTAFFEKHYHCRTYIDSNDLVVAVQRWLAETLNVTLPEEMKRMRLLLPNGIGDSMWALLKAQAVVGQEKLDIDLSGNPSREVDQRSVPFLKRFSFVRDVRVTDIPILKNREHPTDEQGRYDYIADGLHGNHYVLVPNYPLERGKRIEEWLPEHPVNWDIINEFSFANTERGTREGKAMAPFAAFYLGPESGHCDEGHNWKWLWEPKHWVQLGSALKRRGLNVCVIGARYDRSFWERYVREGVEQDGQRWEDRIGEFEIGETFAFLKEAKFLISYQCGLGIVYHYLGGKVAMWWRPAGDSIHPRYLVSFDERMKDAWLRPGWEQNYMGLIYRKETPLDIITEIDKRGWCD